MPPRMPGHTASPPHDAQQSRLVMRVAFVAALGAAAVWVSNQYQNLGTQWDLVCLPIVALSCLMTGLVLMRRPQWLTPASATTLVVTSAYLQGVLYLDTQTQTLTDIYAVASISQVMPLLYVVAYVSLRQGAAWFSWAHYAGVLLQYIWLANAPVPDGGWGEMHIVTRNTLFAAVLAQPACILALNFIVQLRDRLHAAQREAFQSKERFLAMLSHEIRTPLQAMLASIDLLSLKVHNPPERRAVDRIRNAASQLDTHLRDLTEYTRLENPAWQLHTDTVNVATLLHEVAEHFQAQAHARGLALITEITPADEAALAATRTDARRLRQVLLNLVSNAIKYTPAGSVTLRAQRADADVLSSSLVPIRPPANAAPAAAGPVSTTGTVLLEVIDTGIGIPAAEVQRIFEPYIRLEDRRTAGQEGSGLGLAIVQRLVERLGGQLQVSSQPDQGSRFSVTLPLQHGA